MGKNKEKVSYLNENGLTRKQQDFCIYYVETGNASEAARRAGYSKKSAQVIGKENLLKPLIIKEIQRLTASQEKERENAIMDAQEVMERFTRIARGEDKDQFGIEISAADRLKALVEIAKRTVDVDNRANGKADAKVEIALDWTRNE